MILMIAFLVREALKEDVEEPVVEVEIELSFQGAMRKKLNELILSELDLKNSTIEETVEFLRLRSIELEEEEDPRNRGIGFVVRGSRTVKDNDGDDALDAGDAFDPNGKVISLSAKNIGIADALDLVCEEAGLEWKVDEELLKIVISPISQGSKNGPHFSDKLKEIRIPVFELEDATINEAFEVLGIATFEWDLNSGVMNRGVNWVLRFPKLNLESEKEESEEKEFETPYTKKVTLSVKDQTVFELLDLVCKKYGLMWRVEDFSIAIAIGPVGMAEIKLTPREEDPDDPFGQAADECDTK